MTGIVTKIFFSSLLIHALLASNPEEQSNSVQYAAEPGETQPGMAMFKRIPHPTWRQQGRVRHFAASIPSALDAYDGSAGGSGRLAGYFDYASRPLFMRYRRHVQLLPYNYLQALLDEG